MGENMDKIKVMLDNTIVTEDQIPSIPLYMDQVTGYLDDIFSNYKRNEKEKVLTKTMINNYVKAEVLESPAKKKYSKEQIMKLIMIYNLKNIIQINEIEQILNTFSNITTTEMYKIFANIEKDVKRNVKKDLADLDKSDRLETILQLLLSANLQKKIAEILIDELKTESRNEKK